MHNDKFEQQATSFLLQQVDGKVEKNWFPNPDVGVVRLGYSGFLSAIWVLWRMNRNAKKLGLQSKCELTLPMRWLR